MWALRLTNWAYRLHDKHPNLKDLCWIWTSSKFLFSSHAALPGNQEGDTYITTTYKGEKVLRTRFKKGSVSWLLAAAIRMCKNYPSQCLRQEQLETDGLDMSSLKPWQSPNWPIALDSLGLCVHKHCVHYRYIPDQMTISFNTQEFILDIQITLNAVEWPWIQLRWCPLASWHLLHALKSGRLKAEI